VTATAPFLLEVRAHPRARRRLDAEGRRAAVAGDADAPAAGDLGAQLLVPRRDDRGDATREKLDHLVADLHEGTR
jgi:hypothetical protein